MSDHDSPRLFIVLAATPLVHIIPKSGRDDVIVGGSRYQLVQSELGFYDFLRNHDRQIIGLRLSTFKHEPILDYAVPLSYTYVDRKRSYIEVYFCGHRGILAHGTAEQAFGDDSVWRNEDGNYAIQVGTTRLSPEELDELRKITAQASA